MLAELTIKEFMSTLSSDSPVPGGGSVAALCGAGACSLIAMVASLTIGKKGYEDSWEEMASIKSHMDKISREFLNSMDEDAASYQKVISCFQMPKLTDEEKENRNAAIQAATIGAALVPLAIAEKASTLFDYARRVILKGNKNAASDGEVALLMARTSVLGALYNVKINAESIKDPKIKADLLFKVSSLEQEANAHG